MILECGSVQSQRNEMESDHLIMGMDTIEFCSWLADEKKLDGELVQRFSKNKICGCTFLSLTEEDLKELLPVIGERVRVRQLLKEIKQVRYKHVQVLHSGSASTVAIHNIRAHSYPLIDAAAIAIVCSH